MKRTVLVVTLVAAVSLPMFGADMLGMGLSIGVGANKDLMDAGYTAVDLSVAASLALLPIQIDDLAAGVTIRATAGWTVVSDEVIIGWYALTPLLTLAFSDGMSISAGYGPYAYADVPNVYLYGPAVVLGFDGLEIGFVGAAVFVGFGFGF
jgi:hypothetical protein